MPWRRCGFGPPPVCGFGPIGWGGGLCGPRFVGGWGWPAFGSVSCGTGFAFGGTRFWSGTTVLGVPGWGGCGPFWGGWGPGWCGVAPAWGGCGPVWGGCGPAWSGWGPGWCGFAPAWGGSFNAFGPVWGGGVGAWYRGWNPGPARGWNVPFAARGNVRPAVRPAGAVPAAGGFEGRALVADARIDARVAASIRTTNAPGRARAARLVEIGDRHLRDAVDDPKKLARAIDAYRRAAAIAADQPDIRIRQAIALAAAGKDSAASAALDRAVAIDSRLAAAAASAAVAARPGQRAPTALDVRTAKLLASVFPEGGHAAADNWIARRWHARGPGMLLASRP